MSRKSAITAADLLNDRVIPFFDERGIKLQRTLADRGAEYCGKPENPAYQLYLAVEDIDHSRTKANIPSSTVSVSGFTRPCRTSATACSSGRNCTGAWRSCSPTWMLGWRSTIGNGPILAATVPRRHLGRLSRPAGVWP